MIISMKKILLGILFVSVIWVGYGAYAQEEFTSPEALVTNITKVMPTLPLSGQLDKIQLYEKSIDNLNIDSNSKEKLRNYLEQKQEDILTKIEAESLRFSYETLANTNRDSIVQYRLDEHNAERAKKWLAPLTYDKDLEMSSYARSSTVRDLGKSTHKRTESDPYYSYDSIKDWFANLGIAFDDSGTAFTESIGRWYYNCKSNECTQAAIKAIGSTWNFFMSEKPRNWSHYKAIVSPLFTKIWLGVSIDPKTKKYYLVTHYSR